MAVKTKKNKTEEDQTPEAVELVIKPEHLRNPHSIEIRRMGGAHVVEARLEDHRHSQTLGAATVESILREHGAEMPEDENAALVITFSPYNGAIMAIAHKAAVVTKPVDGETKTGDFETGESLVEQSNDAQSEQKA